MQQRYHHRALADVAAAAGTVFGAEDEPQPLRPSRLPWLILLGGVGIMATLALYIAL